MSNIKLKTPSGGSVQLTPTDTSGNYTVTIPASNDTLLVQGDGASAAVYTPAGTGAVATTVQAKLRDGAVIAENYHRASLQPGDDLAGQAPRVVAIAGAVWTPEVVAAYQALTQA